MLDSPGANDDTDTSVPSEQPKEIIEPVTQKKTKKQKDVQAGPQVSSDIDTFLNDNEDIPF